MGKIRLEEWVKGEEKKVTRSEGSEGAVLVDPGEHVLPQVVVGRRRNRSAERVEQRLDQDRKLRPQTNTNSVVNKWTQGWKSFNRESPAKD